MIHVKVGVKIAVDQSRQTFRKTEVMDLNYHVYDLDSNNRRKLKVLLKELNNKRNTVLII